MNRTGERLLFELHVIFFLFLFKGTLLAQDNTMYLMHEIPQANQLNPAIINTCMIYVGLPVISSVKINARNTGFGFHDLIHRYPGEPSDIYSIDLSSLGGKLKRMNYFLTETDIDLLGFGFAYKEWYFTLDVANHLYLQFAYPNDITFVADGNWQLPENMATPVSLNKLGVNATAWNSIGASAAKKLNEGLSAGVRIKYLQGMANMNTRGAVAELATTTNPVTINALLNYSANVSFPVTLGYDANGLINKANADNAFNNIAGDYIFNGNRGIGIDAGIVYKTDERTTISASFTDLGFIRWRKNVNNYKASGKYYFSGVNLDQYMASPGNTDFIKALTDSLLGSFDASGSKNSYSTFMPVKLFGGFTHVILPDLNFGIATKILFPNLIPRPSLTLSLNYKPLPFLWTSLSYTLSNGKFDQVGAGIVAGNRGAQFYLVADNIPLRYTRDSVTSLIWPYNARMISIRFGLNLVFRCKPKDRLFHPPGSKGALPCPAYD